MTSLHDIGFTIKSYRKRQGMSVSALADRSGIHRNTLSALERGVGNVELNTLLAVCEQLGLDLVPTPQRVATFLREEGFRPAQAGALKDTDPPPASQGEAIKAFNLTGSRSGANGEPAPTALQKRIAARLSTVHKTKTHGKP
ncbi:MAG: helix-turn-helix transcriptional regulator [Pseudomonadota bacterium]